MAQRNLALGLCRVSSDEQLSNNSLNRQQENILKAAKQLEVTIPEEYWWIGSVSSKRGTNISRKDLKEAVERCRKDKRIKYVIVDEPDRFMRSINEAAYYEVVFGELNVTVWYASDPDLNKGGLSAKLLKFTKYLAAEGSNEERQRKSIAGQTKALQEGRWPFKPKPGYMCGTEDGVPVLHPERGPSLQKVLKRLAAGIVTPTDALKELNRSEFTNGHAPYKMDKFRKIATDPFYAGVVEMNKQVQVRNENGLHEPLITLKEHAKVVETMNTKPKYQSGPNRKGNPLFPMNNILVNDECRELKNGGRLVGFKHSNGKNPELVYEKYRCRSCKRYWHKANIHEKVTDLFNRYEMTDESRSQLMEALEIVWKRNEQELELELQRVRKSIAAKKDEIKKKIDFISSESSIPESIKQGTIDLIKGKEEEVKELEREADKLSAAHDDDWQAFLEFALDFIENTGKHFLDPRISKENRGRCKQLIFPAGIMINKKNIVYTPEISTLYRLASIKKGAEAPDNSHLVQGRRF